MLLKFAVQDFMDDREFRNLSEETLKSYNNTIKEFHDYCIENKIIDVLDIKPRTIKNYLIYCQKVRKNKATSINHKLRNIKIFFNYLEEIEIVTKKTNPARKVKHIKEDVKIEVFSDYQIRQMLNYYRRLKHRDKTFYSYRDYTIIVTLLGTGVRLGELVNLQWRHIDLRNRIISVFGKKRITRSIPIAEKLSKELAEYYIFCQQYFGELNEYVFTDNQNERMSKNAVQNMFKRLKEVMNFKNVRLSCHTFRHTFAHRCLTNGMDAFSLQKMLGHQKIDQTMKYVALWGTALKDQNEKYNPLNHMNI